MNRFALVVAAALLFLHQAVFAAIKTEVVTYKDGATELEGFLAYDDAAKGKSPGVLVVHQWTGISAHEKEAAVNLAKLGYVAFACDIYGKGVRPKQGEASGAEAGKYKKFRAVFRRRLNVGLEQLKGNKLVDAKKIAAIGYCFGGTGVLELARSGADVRGVVSFHGGLDSPAPADGKNITAKVLVCHGADDPFVPEADIAAFQKELRESKVDWRMIYYGGAVHAFTQKDADGSFNAGAKYNEAAARHSWADMRAFLTEIFEKS